MEEHLFMQVDKSLGCVGWVWVGGAWHDLRSKEKAVWLEQSEGKDAKREEQEGRGQMFGFYSTCVPALNFNKPLGSMCAVLSPVLSLEM